MLFSWSLRIPFADDFEWNFIHASSWPPCVLSRLEEVFPLKTVKGNVLSFTNKLQAKKGYCSSSLPSLLCLTPVVLTIWYQQGGNGSKAIGCRVGFLFLSKFCKKCRLNHVNPSRNSRDISKTFWEEFTADMMSLMTHFLKMIKVRMCGQVMQGRGGADVQRPVKCKWILPVFLLFVGWNAPWSLVVTGRRNVSWREEGPRCLFFLWSWMKRWVSPSTLAVDWAWSWTGRPRLGKHVALFTKKNWVSSDNKRCFASKKKISHKREKHVFFCFSGTCLYESVKFQSQHSDQHKTNVRPNNSEQIVREEILLHTHFHIIVHRRDHHVCN